MQINVFKYKTINSYLSKGAVKTVKKIETQAKYLFLQFYLQ